MDLSNRKGAGYRPVATAAVVAFCLALPATAQTATTSHVTGHDAADNERKTDQRESTTPDLAVVTHDVVGKAGIALPLDIKLLRARAVEVEGIKLLGLPMGATVSDTTNTFSPSNDNKDVDITSWDLTRLQITVSGDRESSFLLAVAAIWQPVDGGRLEVASSLLRVRFVRDSTSQADASDGRPGGDGGTPARIREATPAAQPDHDIAGQHRSTSDVYVSEAQVAPLLHTGAINRPAAMAVTDETTATKAQATAVPRPAMASRPTPPIDPLVERARGLIKLGDISGARLLLERAQARNAPNATFLLAQTWDPAMLRTWKVRGLRADPDLARSLYARAAGQERSDERLLAATGR